MYDRQKEIREAITAGERARMSLQTAHDKLGSARNWGIVDILGGGLISGLMKHSRVNDASYHVEQAKRNLLSFQQELGDRCRLEMVIGGDPDCHRRRLKTKPIP